MKPPRKRNPIAKAVRNIKPKVVPDKRRKKISKALAKLAKED